MEQEIILPCWRVQLLNQSPADDPPARRNSIAIPRIEDHSADTFVGRGSGIIVPEGGKSVSLLPLPLAPHHHHFGAPKLLLDPLLIPIPALSSGILSSSMTRMVRDFSLYAAGWFIGGGSHTPFFGMDKFCVIPPPLLSLSHTHSPLFGPLLTSQTISASPASRPSTAEKKRT